MANHRSRYGERCRCEGAESGLSFQHSFQRDQDTRTNETCDQITEPATKAYTEQAEQRIRNDRAKDAQYDIGQQAVIALHELFGHPTCETADYDCCKPAYLLFFHKH